MQNLAVLLDENADTERRQQHGHEYTPKRTRADRLCLMESYPVFNEAGARRPVTPTVRNTACCFLQISCAHMIDPCEKHDPHYHKRYRRHNSPQRQGRQHSVIILLYAPLLLPFTLCHLHDGALRRCGANVFQSRCRMNNKLSDLLVGFFALQIRMCHNTEMIQGCSG